MPEPNNTTNKIQEEIEYSWLVIIYFVFIS